MNEEQAEGISRAGRTQDHVVSDIVRDVMSPRPRIVSASATVVEAAEVMRARDSRTALADISAARPNV